MAPSAWRSCPAIALAGSLAAAVAEASEWRSRWDARRPRRLGRRPGTPGWCARAAVGCRARCAAAGPARPAGGLAGLNQQQPQGRAVGLLVVVVAQRVDAKAGRLNAAWLAGVLSGPTTSSLPRPPSGRGRPVAGCWSMLDSAWRNRTVPSSRSRSCHSRPHSSPVRAPVAAARTTKARSHGRRSPWAAASRTPTCWGVRVAGVWAGMAGGSASVAGLAGWSCHFHRVAERLVQAQVQPPDGAGTQPACRAILAAVMGQPGDP
jgi:hypothetical protein